MQLPGGSLQRHPKNNNNRQESISLLCIRSNNHDDYEFGGACIGIYDYQITGFKVKYTLIVHIFQLAV